MVEHSPQILASEEKATITPTRTPESLTHPLYFPDLALCLFLVVVIVVPTPQEMSCWAETQLEIILRISHFPDSTRDHSSDKPCFQPLLPHIEFKRAFLQWLERPRKCDAADREYSKSLQWKKVVCSENALI